MNLTPREKDKLLISRVDCKPAMLEQLVEHAPGEGAMRASTLQRQVYWFLIGRGWRAALIPCHGIVHPLREEGRLFLANGVAPFCYLLPD
jgi:hypothetical protein